MSRRRSLPPKCHELKTWPRFFEFNWIGIKGFEIRKNDRGFQRGDQIRMREWNPDTERFTGREIGGEIRYITDFGQRAGYVVFDYYETGRTTG